MKNVRNSTIIHAGPWHWECVTFGHGPEAMFAFHGFDNEAADWQVFEPELGERYTLYCINLFHHGESFPDADHQAPFEASDLERIFSSTLEKYRINRFSLLGFSLGGRVCLELLALYTDRIERVFLLAADGLKTSRWYNFLTSNPVGNRWFRKAVHDPEFFLRTAALLKRMKLLGEKQYKFAWSYFNTPEKRQKVYDVWMTFRKLQPDRRKIATKLTEHQLRIDLVFGARDTVIPAVNARPWKRQLGGACHVHILDTGHNLLKPEVARLVASR